MLCRVNLTQNKNKKLLPIDIYIRLIDSKVYREYEIFGVGRSFGKRALFYTERAAKEKETKKRRKKTNRLYVTLLQMHTSKGMDGSGSAPQVRGNSTERKKRLHFRLLASAHTAERISLCSCFVFAFKFSRCACARHWLAHTFTDPSETADGCVLVFAKNGLSCVHGRQIPTQTIYEIRDEILNFFVFFFHFFLLMVAHIHQNLANYRFVLIFSLLSFVIDFSNLKESTRFQFDK